VTNQLSHGPVLQKENHPFGLWTVLPACLFFPPAPITGTTGLFFPGCLLGAQKEGRLTLQEPARLQETSRSDVLRIYCLPDWQFPQSGWWRGAQLPIPAALGNDQLSTI